MSFFTNLRADRLVTEIRPRRTPQAGHAENDCEAEGPGSGAIEPVFAALPEADKNATVAFVEVLSGW